MVERYSRAEIEQRLENLAEVRFRGSSLERWSDEERGYDGEPACHKCIGACCALLDIRDLNWPEYDLLVEHGTVTAELVFEMSGWPRGKVVDIIHTSVNDLLPDSDQAADIGKIRQIAKKPLGQKSYGVTPTTACGILDECGDCSKYEQRPETCRDFTEGSETCCHYFVAKGSEAALEIQDGFNLAEPLIKSYAGEILETEMPTREFDFSE